jgi:hypothetical protein
MTIVHRVEATKQKRQTTSTLQKNKEKQNKHKNKATTMKIREKKLLMKGDKISYMRTMITTHQKKVAKQNKTIAS